MEKHLSLLADSIAEKKVKEGEEEREEKVGESRSEKKIRQKRQKCQKRKLFLVMAGVLVVVVGVNLVRALSCKQLMLLGVLVFLLVHLLCFFFSRIFRRKMSPSSCGLFPCPFKSKHKKNKNKKKDQKKQHHHNPSSPSSTSPPLDGR
jgi:hypothetical protein